MENTTFRCIKCGATIDQWQANKFNNCCPDCVKLQQKQSISGSSSQTGRIMRMTEEIKSKNDSLGALIWFGAVFLIAGITGAMLLIFMGPGSVAFVIMIVGLIGAPILLGMSIKLRKRVNELRKELNSLK